MLPSRSRGSASRRTGALLIGVTLSLLATTAGAQQATPSATAPAAPASAPAPPAPAATTAAQPPHGGTASSPPPSPAEPIEEPPYDPAQHHGLSEGAWLRATRGTARRSAGMMATGIVLATLGVSLMAGGTGVAVAGDHCNTPSGGVGLDGNPQTVCGPRTAQATGMALLSAGLIAAGLGVPLLVLGASDVPRAEAGSLSTPAVPSTPRVIVGLGLRGATLALHF